MSFGIFVRDVVSIFTILRIQLAFAMRPDTSKKAFTYILTVHVYPNIFTKSHINSLSVNHLTLFNTILHNFITTYIALDCRLVADRA